MNHALVRLYDLLKERYPDHAVCTLEVKYFIKPDYWYYEIHRRINAGIPAEFETVSQLTLYSDSGRPVAYLSLFRKKNIYVFRCTTSQVSRTESEIIETMISRVWNVSETDYRVFAFDYVKGKVIEVTFKAVNDPDVLTIVKELVQKPK